MCEAIDIRALNGKESFPGAKVSLSSLTWVYFNPAWHLLLSFFLIVISF